MLRFGPAAISFHMGLPAELIAAGGIGDGRGIAAAFALGAQGVSLGTRFLASTEMTIDRAWKDRIVVAGALDAVKVPHSERGDATVHAAPDRCSVRARRALRTELIDNLEADPDSVGHARPNRASDIAQLRVIAPNHVASARWPRPLDGP